MRHCRRTFSSPTPGRHASAEPQARPHNTMAGTVHAHLAQMLLATGQHDQRTSDLMARWADAFYTTMAARTNTAPQALYDRFPLRIRGGLAADAADAADALEAEIDQKAFRRWFGASKVVDGRGDPLVVYHGGQKLTAWQDKTSRNTQGVAEGADRRPQIYGGHAQAVKDAYGSMLTALERQHLDRPVHFFTDDQSVAEGYADQGSHYEVRREFLRMERPLDLRIDVVGTEAVEQHLRAILGPDFEMPALGYGQYRHISQALRWNWSDVRDKVQAMGFDGLIFHDTDVLDRGKHTGYAVFSPQQIKSADANDGSFDLDDPDRLSQGPVAAQQRAGAAAPRQATDPNAHLGLRSALLQAVLDLPTEQASPNGWRQAITGLLNRGAAKAPEVHWTGLLRWLGVQEAPLGTSRRISRQQIVDHLLNEGVRLREAVLSDEALRELPDGWYIVDTGLTRGDELFVIFNSEDAVVAHGRTQQAALDSLIESDLYAEDQRSPLYAGHVVAPHLMPAQSSAANAQKPSSAPTRYREVLLILDTERGRNIERRMQLAALDRARPLSASEQAEFESLRDFAVRSSPGNTTQVGESAKGSFLSKHWAQPDVLVHFRVDDRVDVDGERVLMVHEIQSDWGQLARTQGFGLQTQDLTPVFQVIDAKGHSIGVYADEASARQRIADDHGRRVLWSSIPLDTSGWKVQLQKVQSSREGVPQAPFVATASNGTAPARPNTQGWLHLALKRIALMAAQGGYDRVAFITGEKASELFGLRQPVTSIKVWGAVSPAGCGSSKEHEGTIEEVGGVREMELHTAAGAVIRCLAGPAPAGVLTSKNPQLHGKSLAEVVGPQLAQQILSNPAPQTLHGRDLDYGLAQTLEGGLTRITLGDHGMRSFYDQVVPATLKQLLPKFEGRDTTPGKARTQLRPIDLPLPQRRLRVMQSLPDQDGRPRWMVVDDATAEYVVRPPGKSQTQSQATQATFGSILLAHRWEHPEQAQEALSLISPQADPARVYGFDVTPAMREHLTQGLPLFQDAVQDPRHARRGAFDPRTLEIALGPKADASTWIHETGHFFLEVLAELASQPNAPPPIVRDFDTVLSWFGVTREEWSRFTLDDKRPHHERWAQAVELYVMQGRAASEELLPVLEVFSTWLTAVYGSTCEFLESVARSMKDLVAPTSRPEFRSWFGLSKVVDAQGEPLVVYHGTDQEFTVFDYSRIGSRGRSEGAGFYFTNSHDVASGYGSPMQVYLSIQKPLAYDAGPFSKAVLEKILRRAAELEAKSTVSELADGFLSNFGDIRSEGLEAVVRSAAILIAADATALDQLSGMVGSGVSPKHVNEALRDVTGFDGVVANGFSNEGSGDNRIFVALFPEQIKSATGNDGSFDQDDPNILSQGPKAPCPLGLTDDIRRVMDRLLSVQAAFSDGPRPINDPDAGDAGDADDAEPQRERERMRA